MSDHSRALVPLESWSYNSPELLAVGKSIDLGLFAEALIYYDGLYVNLTTQPQFAAFVEWFANQRKLADLLALFSDGTLKVYEHAFITSAVEMDDNYFLINIQDSLQEQPRSFLQRFLHHPSLKAVIPSSRQREKLKKALRDSVIEVKADQYGAAIDNARQDIVSPERSALLLQAFLDELYTFRGLGPAPKVVANILPLDGGERHTITYNVDFRQIATIAGDPLNFHNGIPLTGAAHSNRLLWSAAGLDCDLYVGSPMSRVIGNKLFESGQRSKNPDSLIESLQASVEFPDIRKLVNSGQLSLKDVLRIRKKAGRFRQWLQNESDRDRDAIIAYHNEVARESGLVRGTRRILAMFGVLGQGAAAVYLDSKGVDPIADAVIVAGGGYVLDLASKLGADWRPVVFGSWIKDEIANIVAREGTRR